MPKPTVLKRAIFDSQRTQRDIAVEVGIREDKLSRIVNGLHCDDATRQKIANALCRNISDLFPSDEQEGEAA